MAKEDSRSGDLVEKVIRIRRCAAVVKGGRRFSFNGMVVVGNGRGKVGAGYGKANEVPPAVEKAIKDGSRQMIEVPLEGSTIAHPVLGHFGASDVILLPASPGTGVIAGAAVRAVCEAAGIHDVLTKTYGSTNPINVVKATLNALKQLRTQVEVQRLRRGDFAMNISDVHRGIEKHTKRLRIGRGIGSGRGKTSGRGHKGQGQLAGWAAPVIFEGARMPLIRRIPKRGFHNQWGLRVATVNLGELQDAFKSGDEVNLETLKAAGLCKRPSDALKVLGHGELKKKLKISANKFSASALEKIKEAGGEAIVLPGPKPVVRKKPKAGAAK